MEWNHLLLSHLWHFQSANKWPLAHLTLVFTSRPPVLSLVPIIGPLSVCTVFQCLAIPCQSLAILRSVACEFLSHVADGAGDLEDPLTDP